MYVFSLATASNAMPFYFPVYWPVFCPGTQTSSAEQNWYLPQQLHMNCPGPEAEPEHNISSDKNTARRTGQKLIGRDSSVILVAATTSCLKIRL